MRDYELVFILDPGLSATKQEDVRESLRKVVATLGGQITEENDWGPRPFPYLVKKQREGLWNFWRLNLPPEAPNKFRYELRIRDGMLRFMLCRAVELSKANRSRKAKIAAREGTPALAG